MTLEVLVSTVNSNPKELIKKMNINSDAIIINQCDKNSYEEIKLRDNLIKVYNFNERGIGLSRNNALMRAKADIVLFADDDEVFEDNYKEIIVNEFEKNEKADMIVFNIKGNSANRKVYQNTKNKRIHKYNCLRYGAVRMAAKLDSIKKKNILFSLIFGGGTKYGSGEDSIFIYDCIKKGIRVYSSNQVICLVDFSESSWFSGYNEKFFYDKGALLYSLHGKNVCFFIFVFLIRHKYMWNNIGLKKSLNCMIKGYKDIR